MSMRNTDFNMAMKMNRHGQEDERRYAKNDWKRFFNSICSFCRVSWFAIDRRDNKVS